MRKLVVLILVAMSFGCVVRQHTQQDKPEVRYPHYYSFEDPQQRVQLIGELSLQCIELNKKLNLHSNCSFAYIAKKYADKPMYRLWEAVQINKEVLNEDS